ncbi:related to cytochrome P450 CYP3/CYP5/CYP6/CYP9 subfamilies [Phialocephala subalpina]|uniref:Related to cytochrome P450 CYP3/CYP5/CYP6/CYP9 subfamilies n=1 Tax=Phialocephala subalpina TaxID=576137 RepID=A0A1L7XS43_9HELO|nr:related to cytochrome P450 CYP3/CYP5/CYP6/CYP9 subfamilies [Phialocephala subalpina]
MANALFYSSPWIDISSSVVAAVAVYITSLVVYRRWFHPLAEIPGPFWASVTHFYIVKYNLFSERSQFYLQVEKLHRKYGPVVRISPDEIHLADPENYEKLHYVGSKAPSKAPYFYDAFGLKIAAFGTTSNELHRIRRAAISPAFSRKAVLQLEDIVQEKTAKLINRIKDLLDEGKPVDLHHGFRALSVDIITDYSFDNDYKQLDSPTFGSDFYEMTSELITRGWVLQAFPFLLPLSDLITLPMAKRINGALYEFLLFRKRCVEQIATVKKEIDEGRDKSKHKTIFHQLLDPNASEGHVVPNVEELTEEMFTILTAGGETTGHAMTMITYYVLSNPEIYRKLVSELKTAFPEKQTTFDYLTLEKLPYLSSVIKEGLRLSYGVPGRLPRVIETPDAIFNGYRVPKGTTVGMSAWMLNRNPQNFPEPEQFIPERWSDPEKSKRLENKYFAPFGRGSRQCVGMHLAYLELYIGIGSIFRNFDRLRVDNFGPEDLEFDDYFGPFFRPTQNKFHVALDA